jgi:hypothetical protein
VIVAMLIVRSAWSLLLKSTRLLLARPACAGES